MKVAFVTSEYPPHNPGGAGISSKLIADALKSSGIDVTVFALAGQDRQISKIDENTWFLPAESRYPGPKAIGECISTYLHVPKMDEFDILHVYNTRHLPACIVRNSPPVVSTMNNHMWICTDAVQHFREGLPKYSLSRAFKHTKTGGYTGLGRFFRTGVDYIGKKIAKKSDVFTAQTNGMKIAMEQSGYSRDKIEIVPNILDENFELNKDKEGKKIIFVGQFQPNKAPGIVVRAFEQLSKKYRGEWKLEMYGNGPLKKDIKAYIQKNELDNISLRYSAYNDLPKVYSEASLLIHSSQYVEPFSRTWLEAMASDTPILCSDNPSSRAALGDIAEFYKPFDSLSLAKSIEVLINNEHKREDMVKAGRENIDQYRPNRIAKQYVKVYKKALKID